MANLRPTVFVGSSAEGLEIAEAIQQNLDHSCEVTLWSQGVFGLSGGTLESLVSRLDGFDFAILVLTPNDLVSSRGETLPAPRDNVLLELGLCIGALGRERTFIVYERNKPIKLPSDLAGVTPADYEQHSDGNLQSSLGAATTAIKKAIQKLEKRRTAITANIDITTQFQIIHGLLDPSAEQFLIWMAENNKTLQRGERYFGFGIGYEYELRGQRGAGRGHFSMDSLCIKLPDAGLLQVDLRNNVALTQRGQQFAEWLVENGHKAAYFHSDIGNWGEPTKGVHDHWPDLNPFEKSPREPPTAT